MRCNIIVSLCERETFDRLSTNNKHNLYSVCSLAERLRRPEVLYQIIVNLQMTRAYPRDKKKKKRRGKQIVSAYANEITAIVP